MPKVDVTTSPFLSMFISESVHTFAAVSSEIMYTLNVNQFSQELARTAQHEGSPGKKCVAGEGYSLQGNFSLSVHQEE